MHHYSKLPSRFTPLLAAVFSCWNIPLPAAEIENFRRSAWFEEQVHQQWLPDGIRVYVNAPGNFDASKPTLLVLYATPNGNSVYETLGSRVTDRNDWRYDIQHVAAQIRRLREVEPQRQIVLACLEAEGQSWPAWRQRRRDASETIKKTVATVRGWIPATEVKIALAAHSGGGSFLFGFLNSQKAIPDEIESIVFLDANYSYSDADGHGAKLLDWLKRRPAHALVVIAYDDRRITLDGKPVVGPTGGTYRASERMIGDFTKSVDFAESHVGEFRKLSGMNGQVTFLIHANPQNKILHTALVGDMNGLLCGLTRGATSERWGTLAGPRAYEKWIQPAAAIPARPAEAIGGRAFFKSLDALSRERREEAIAREILRGNFPKFLRDFKPVKLTGTVKFAGTSAAGKQVSATIEVMPDYLAVGSDEDFVRVPLDPRTACRIAEAFGCSLPTRKMVDAIYNAATIKLAPRPLTEEREAPGTFLRHNQIIEEQRAGRPCGPLIAGIKKDLVLTNRLEERANRVAIYGWHKLDGKPIQPLNVSHVRWYADYSHGVRLVKLQAIVDGKPRDLRTVLFAADLSAAVSDEGPIRDIDY